MNKLAAAVLFSCLSGCAMQSRVVHLPDGVLQVSVVATAGAGGVEGARAMALDRANAHCDYLRKHIFVASVDTAPNVVTVTFKCD